MVVNPSIWLNRVISRPKVPLGRYLANPQPVDYKRVFLQTLELCDAFSGPITHDLTDIPGYIRTTNIQNFYGCARLEVLGTTHRNMQRIFDNQSFRPDADGRVNHSKKWRRYKSGKTMPGRKTLAKIEEVCGVNFAPEVHQPLWTAMDITVPVGNRMTVLVEGLNEEIRGLALSINAKMHPQKEPIDSDISDWCYSLGLKAGLPALAALTLLLRRANEIGDKSTMAYVSRSLFQMLLVLGPDLQQRGIAYLLYPFYLKHIFPLYSGYELDESACGMARMSMVLNLLAFVGKRSSAGLDYKDRVKNMYQWLCNFRGSVPSTAFAPRFRPSSAGDELRHFNAMQLQWQSAWRTLSGIIATGRAPTVFRRRALHVDLDYSVLADHQRELLLDIAGQMLAN